MFTRTDYVKFETAFHNVLRQEHTVDCNDTYGYVSADGAKYAFTEKDRNWGCIGLFGMIVIDVPVRRGLERVTSSPARTTSSSKVVRGVSVSRRVPQLRLTCFFFRCFGDRSNLHVNREVHGFPFRFCESTPCGSENLSSPYCLSLPLCTQDSVFQPSLHSWVSTVLVVLEGLCSAQLRRTQM